MVRPAPTRRNTALLWVTLACLCFWGAVMVLAAILMWGPEQHTLRDPKRQLVQPIERSVLT